MSNTHNQALATAARQVQRDTGVPFQAARRVAALLHQYQLLVDRTVNEETSRDDSWQVGDFASMLVIDRLLIDFIPAIAFIAKVVPLVDDLLTNVAALQVGPAVAQAVRATWTPCRACLLTLAEAGDSADRAVKTCMDRPIGYPMTEADRLGLYDAVVAINTSMPPSVAATERTSDALLRALLAAPPESDLEMALEPWESIESELGCLVHCGRRLHVHGERLMGRSVEWPPPKPVQRLLFRDGRKETPPHLWTAAARRAERDEIERASRSRP